MVNEQAASNARPANRSVAEELGDAKGQVDRLAGVQSGVADRGVALVELVLRDVHHPTQAFGHVVAGELDVHAARPGADLACAAKKPWSSARMSSKRRVLCPPSATKVLPCIGSQTHTTGWPVVAHGLEQRGQ